MPEKHICEHEGCVEEGDGCFLYTDDDEPNGYYCSEHAFEHGFCYGCGLFWGGVESFDFGTIRGLCEHCADQARYDAGEYDDDEEDYEYWHYNHAWYDPDIGSDGEDSTGVYIGPDEN